MSFCRKCGLSHEKLSVQVKAGTLTRFVHRSVHLLHMNQEAWGFLSQLIDSHPEIENFLVIDKDRDGRTYYMDRQAFEEHAFKQDLGRGMQTILPLEHWRVGLAADHQSN